MEVGNLHLAVPNSFIYDGNLEVDENILRLAVAINADGTWRKHLTAAGNSQKTARNTKFTKNDTAIRDIYEIRVKKLRKADRLRILLNNANIAYDNKSYACKDGFYYCFRFRFPFNAKVFPDEWFNLSLKCKKILINELFYWDGNIQMKASIDKNHVRKTYSTSKKHDADFIEFVLASSGIGVHTYLDLRSKHINYNISPISH